MLHASPVLLRLCPRARARVLCPVCGHASINEVCLERRQSAEAVMFGPQTCRCHIQNQGWMWVVCKQGGVTGCSASSIDTSRSLQRAIGFLLLDCAKTMSNFTSVLVLRVMVHRLTICNPTASWYFLIFTLLSRRRRMLQRHFRFVWRSGRNRA